MLPGAAGLLVAPYCYCTCIKAAFVFVYKVRWGMRGFRFKLNA